MSDNDWWFLDLAVVIASAGVIAFGLFAGLTGIGRVLLVIPLVVFLPGYAFVAVLFPDAANDEYRSFDDEKTGLQNPLLVDGGLEHTERLALSVVVSVAAIPVVTLFATATPRGIVLETVLSGVALLTVIFALLAIFSRYRCHSERRFSPTLSADALFFSDSQPNPYGTTNTRPFNVAIVLGLVLLIASGGFALANPPDHDGFSEFYVETETVTGETETMYDAAYTAGTSQELPVVITNREGTETSYTTVVELQRVSYDGDDVTVHETDELSRETVTLSEGETHRHSLEVSPTMSGDDLRLELLLYVDEPPEDPSAENAYRVIRLPIEVT